MSGPNNSSSLSSFLDAIRNGIDIQTLETLLSINSEVLNHVRTSQENPLMVAYETGNFSIIELIGKKKPKLTGLRNQDGCTLLHLASDDGHLQVVQLLVELDRELCLVKDSGSMIPVHKAVSKGHIDVIQVLISACPKSLQELTVFEETTFHLALKNNRLDAFKILLEEAAKHKQEGLLLHKDDEGNMVLHIAVSQQLLDIVQLLRQSSTIATFAMQVYSLNSMGLTAWDLHFKNPRNPATQEIGHILREARASEEHIIDVEYSFCTQSRRIPRRLLLEMRNVLFVIIGIFSAIAFGVIFMLFSAPNEKYVASKPFQFKSVVSAELPPRFYMMVFITVLIIISMFLMVVLLHSFAFGSCLLVGLVAIFMLYVFLAEYLVPKFLVKIGARYISSSLLLWILALTFIFIIGTVIKFPAKWIFLWFNKFAEWLKRKTRRVSDRLPRVRLPACNLNFNHWLECCNNG